MFSASFTRNATRTVSLAGILGFGVTSGTNFNIKEKMPISKIEVIRPENIIGDVMLSRKICNEADKSGLNLRLYQYETCPFCCKVKAMLDYYGFTYEVVEVNPVTRSQIKFSTDYKKVPMLRSNEELTMTESSLIISQLATFLERHDLTFDGIVDMYPAVDSTDTKGKPIKSYPNKFFVMMGERTLSSQQMAAQKEEREWREWVDDHFIHLISPNVYRSFDESLETFRWFEKVGDWHRAFPTWERICAVYVGAVAMFALSKTLKKRHNIIDERQSLQDACEKWMDAIGPSRKFMGGDKPNLADISLYGAMNSFYGCRAFKEVIAGGRISEWYNSMHIIVNAREGQLKLAERASKITL